MVRAIVLVAIGVGLLACGSGDGEQVGTAQSAPQRQVPEQELVRYSEFAEVAVVGEVALWSDNAIPAQFQLSSLSGEEEREVATPFATFRPSITTFGEGFLVAAPRCDEYEAERGEEPTCRPGSTTLLRFSPETDAFSVVVEGLGDQYEQSWPTILGVTGDEAVVWMDGGFDGSTIVRVSVESGAVEALPPAPIEEFVTNAENSVTEACGSEGRVTVFASGAEGPADSPIQASTYDLAGDRWSAPSSLPDVPPSLSTIAYSRCSAGTVFVFTNEGTIAFRDGRWSLTASLPDGELYILPPTTSIDGRPGVWVDGKLWLFDLDDGTWAASGDAIEGVAAAIEIEEGIAAVVYAQGTDAPPLFSMSLR